MKTVSATIARRRHLHVRNEATGTTETITVRSHKVTLYITAAGQVIIHTADNMTGARLRQIRQTKAYIAAADRLLARAMAGASKALAAIPAVTKRTSKKAVRSTVAAVRSIIHVAARLGKLAANNRRAAQAVPVREYSGFLAMFRRRKVVAPATPFDSIFGALRGILSGSQFAVSNPIVNHA